MGVCSRKLPISRKTDFEPTKKMSIITTMFCFKCKKCAKFFNTIPGKSRAGTRKECAALLASSLIMWDTKLLAPEHAFAEQYSEQATSKPKSRKSHYYSLTTSSRQGRLTRKFLN